ncbi:GNAT family N-acetyltransferase [Cytobacillus sp. FJAT-54145]|uniref:GNAT family N-acetyltransferase n=1 Tax=Cytobacillus spartinae TaxID=3299023 RepID=A0ABW6K5U9_9BACI
MTISLRPITKENWEQCIELQLHKDQEPFMASNLYSIAEVQFLEDFEAMGIYFEEAMVGFTMYGVDPDDDNYWIYRLMIDKDHQGKGYAKQALYQLIQRLGTERKSNLIYVGYHPSNEAAHQLYSRVGFAPKGEAPWGELLACYTLSQ